MVHNRQSKRSNSALSISVNNGLVNKVVNDTSVKPQKTLNRLSVTTPSSFVNQSYNDTVSTHNRFQVLYDLHTDKEEVCSQNELRKDNSVTVSPRNTLISTKVGEMCNLTRITKGREQKSDTEKFCC